MESGEKSYSELIQELNQLKQQIITLEQQETTRRQEFLSARDSEKRYRAIFETTGTATVIVEKNTNILLVNREFESCRVIPGRKLKDKCAEPGLSIRKI